LKQAGLRPTAIQDATHRRWAEAFAAAPDYRTWASRRTELLRGRSQTGMLRFLLDELRTVKTEEEMRVLQKAIDITVEAHREVMKQVQPGWAEYEIEALVEYTFKRLGAEHPGFPSIVGSAENSVILHYETNRRTTEPGDIVVIDIGAEYHGYTADITRTIPVGGRYTPEQRAIYELVYAAQEAGIEAAQAGAAFYAPHQAAQRVLAEGLAELGLISGRTTRGPPTLLHARHQPLPRPGCARRGLRWTPWPPAPSSRWSQGSTSPPPRTSIRGGGTSECASRMTSSSPKTGRSSSPRPPLGRSTRWRP
jgi:Xaa-Pro aminopeptidase